MKEERNLSEFAFQKDFDWVDEVKRVAHGIRRRTLEHTIANNGGYLSQACSSAEIFAVLYVKIMNLGKVEKPLLPRPFSGVPGPENPHAFTGTEFNGPRTADYDRQPAGYTQTIHRVRLHSWRLGL